MEDRRTEERRTEIHTERTYVTHREQLATRTRSPERKERVEKREAARHRASESRPKEQSKPEAPQGRCHVPASILFLLFTLSRECV